MHKNSKEDIIPCSLFPTYQQLTTNHAPTIPALAIKIRKILYAAKYECTTLTNSFVQ